jgi:dihydroorotase
VKQAVIYAEYRKEALYAVCVIMLNVLSAIQTVDKMSAYKMTFDKTTRRLAKELKEIK